MNEWEKVRLGEVCSYASDRVAPTEISVQNYISTENMLPEKAGVIVASGLPTTSQVCGVQKGDVLVSNIRPYFKKIWYADKFGGCSNDVLNFRASTDYHDKFLYYALSNDDFFDYSMSTSKGTKMPRGDRTALMNYLVPLPPLTEQRRIAAILSALDDKIELNNRMNKNLEAQAQSLFKSWFVDFEPFSNVEFGDSELGEIPRGWSVMKLGNVVDSIDNRGKTPPLENAPTNYPIIDVKALSGNFRIVDFTHCTKFVSEDTYNRFFRSGHPRKLDILISTVGSLAEMKLFYGNTGCVAQNVVAFRSKGISPYYLYQYLQSIKSDLIAYNIGSVQPSIKVTHILKHLMLIPDEKILKLYDEYMANLSTLIFNNCKQSQTLATLRDTLLPKLMTGEIDVKEEV